MAKKLPINEAASTISQTCYVVHDLETAVGNWTSKMGAGPFFTLDGLDLGEKIYRGRPGTDKFIGACGFLGSTNIEILQPINDEPSVLQDILRTRGPGLHHIYPNQMVIDSATYDRLYDRYRSAGYAAALELEVFGRRNVMFDAIHEHGCFVELLEMDENIMGIIHAIRDAHLNWDGTDPLRPFSNLIS